MEMSGARPSASQIPINMRVWYSPGFGRFQKETKRTTEAILGVPPKKHEPPKNGNERHVVFPKKTSHQKMATKLDNSSQRPEAPLKSFYGPLRAGTSPPEPAQPGICRLRLLQNVSASWM